MIFSLPIHALVFSSASKLRPVMPTTVISLSLARSRATAMPTLPEPPKTKAFIGDPLSAIFSVIPFALSPLFATMDRTQKSDRCIFILIFLSVLELKAARHQANSGSGSPPNR